VIRIFSKSVTYRAKHLRARDTDDPSVTDRHKGVPGHNQEALSTAKVILIGAGGLGGETGEALVRKGVGTIVIFDHDFVELSNLNRQKFNHRDLFKNKALRLAKNLAKEGFCGSVIQGYGLSLQDAIAWGVDLSCQVAIVGVDNNPSRVAASRFFRQAGTPVIYTAVAADASHGYVFVEEAGEGHACWACMFPKAVNDESWPCPGTPAVMDILKVMGGIVAYAVDSLLMPRLRTWNYKSVYLDGSIPGNDWQVQRREDCALCGRGGVSPALPHAEESGWRGRTIGEQHDR
jgi:sulfur carrier protein ThiS adenylyltransferase